MPVGRMHRFATKFTMRPILPRTTLAKRRACKARPIFRLIEDTRGVTAIEYTLIAALIAVAFVLLIAQIGDFVSVPFQTVASYL